MIQERTGERGAATQLVLGNCLGCPAAPGDNHSPGCVHACCPDCGEQLYMHDDECQNRAAGEPERPAVWHGIDPRDEVAQTLNWWTTVSGIEGRVEDYTRVLFAAGLHQITWDRQAQRYSIGRIDEAALDRAIARSNC